MAQWSNGVTVSTGHVCQITDSDFVVSNLVSAGLASHHDGCSEGAEEKTLRYFHCVAFAVVIGDSRCRYQLRVLATVNAGHGTMLETNMRAELTNPVNFFAIRANLLPLLAMLGS